ncbi:MAG: hypothetical protein ACK5LT_12310 [Lachnospirales bacterium]
MAYKSAKITDKIHHKLFNHCKKNGIKIQDFIDSAIIEKINKEK